MLQLNESGMDEIREIYGIIDKNGNIIPSAIDYLKKLINSKWTWKLMNSTLRAYRLPQTR